MLEVLVLMLQRADVHLGGEEWILTFCPGICHSPWWTVCPGTAAPRGPRSLTSPTLPQAAERQMPPWGGGALEVHFKTAALMFTGPLHRSNLIQDQLLALFSRFFGFYSSKWRKESPPHRWRPQRHPSVTRQCLRLTWQRAYAHTQTSRGSPLVVTWFI